MTTELKIGDAVRVKTGYGWGLNRAFRRACTKRRPPRIVRFLMDAAMLEVKHKNGVLACWVNAKELEAINA